MLLTPVREQQTLAVSEEQILSFLQTLRYLLTALGFGSASLARLGAAVPHLFTFIIIFCNDKL